MAEICFATDGIVIGNREKGIAVDISYGEMFQIVHEFLNECYRSELLTETDGNVTLIEMKRGDGSPFPLIVEKVASGKSRTVQLRCDEIVGLASIIRRLS